MRHGWAEKEDLSKLEQHQKLPRLSAAAVLMNTIVLRNTSKRQSKMCTAARKAALINTKSCVNKFCIPLLPSAMLLRGLPWVSQG
eukprot:8492668-Pyramimonas_sp.AAC.1